MTLKYVTIPALLMKHRSSEVKGVRLNIETDLDQGDLLSSGAKALAATKIDSTLYTVPGTNRMVPCVYASKIVPVTDGHKVEASYVERWCKFLNHLAERGIWKHGALMPLAFIPLANPLIDTKLDLAGRREALRKMASLPTKQGVLISFIFVDRNYAEMDTKNGDFTDYYSDLVRWPKTFVHEGELGTDNWDECPY